MPTNNYECEGQLSIFDLEYGFGKTFQEPCQAMTEKISDVLLKKSQGLSSRKFLYLDLRSGLTLAAWTETDGALHGVSETQLTKECHRDEEESFLSRILEDSAPEKYFLSQRACTGILRRCAKRGKQLPEVLKNALMRQADISEEKLKDLLTEND